MEFNDSLEMGTRTLGLRISVEESTLSSGVVLNTDGVDAPNPLGPAEVTRFGFGIKFGAKGLSNLEGDVSERETDLLAGPKVLPLP